MAEACCSWAGDGMEPETILAQRLRLRVRGRVQGVGFRPFVVRLARSLNLAGFVGNDSSGVFLEIEGPSAKLASFRRRLFGELPPLARILDVEVNPLPFRASADFVVVESVRLEKQELDITPDAAACPDCLAECLDPKDRRYRYAFTNCTNCGPRYSILEELPYDREHTSMAGFTMCPQCQAEYDDPSNRRFHAQPNACPMCGPKLWLSDGDGASIPSLEPLQDAARLLKEGKILAIKGLGGFHLACRADDEKAVKRLRRRKGREAKPLAVMVEDLEAARSHAILGPQDEQALVSTPAPILLVERSPQARIAPSVCGVSDLIGLFLPYTPLHRLLLLGCSLPLVMSSANCTDEPLCFTNEDALKRLKGMVDAFLLHDRPILRPIDDSVLLSHPNGKPSMVRRARGFVPDSIVCSKHARAPIMAFGGDLKSTICLLKERSAVLSEHIGDLENPRAYRKFLEAGRRLRELLRVDPQRYACDLHPLYHSSKFARSSDVDLVEVQHHHAHAVSCMAENHLNGPVLAIICDGTGYGTDGTIWGGEILLARYESFERLAHLTPLPLWGGDAAALEPWRCGAALLFRAYSEDWVRALPHWIETPELLLRQTATEQMRKGSATVPCSSLGRLFDAAAYLLGVCGRNRYEGEAAASLEVCARQAQHGLETRPGVARNESGMWEMDGVRLVLDIVRAREEGLELASCAREFHRGICELFAEAARICARQSGIRKVVLSGGCFVNRILLRELSDALRASGLEVYRHQQIPCGDGGLSFGQALVAAAQD